MSATSFLLALALLTEPPGARLPPLTADDWPALRSALVSLAIEWEIFDEREDRLKRFEEFAKDLDLLRRRRHELADAPPLAEARRLPHPAIAEQLLVFNRAYRRNLERRRELDPDRAADFYETLRETDRLYQTWDAVRDARCEIYYVPVRREALKRLRTLIGPEAFQAGQLPPQVPVWRFVEIK